MSSVVEVLIRVDSRLPSVALAKEGPFAVKNCQGPSNLRFSALFMPSSPLTGSVAMTNFSP